ncbi:CoA transferase [Roseomonas terrae]|uniref:CoA transferase n=1 Tax=Neoroseomonas terrae TaxID=424799 RepID=A0ABS5EEG7_9PROT|nr:CaiB/BaiF CoA-transferase family protein [Neoroseomonas terrae]MBR0649421.1 CoA transferase [Neoroseomonas terrae]
MTRPFEGIRIIDATHVLAGPFAAYQLALLGAEVIKVEHPAEPDHSRSQGGDAALNRSGMGTYFLTQGSNKRSLTLDLKQEAAREVFLKLIPQTDVLVENYRPGAFEAIGLGYEALSKLNPRLIYCSISAFGQKGPRGGMTAYDHVIQASSGIMAATGTAEVNPMKLGAPAMDYATGTMGAFALSAALFQRERTGKGQRIDLSMMDVAMMMMASHVTAHSRSGKPPRPRGNDHEYATSSAYPTRDGLLMIGASNMRQQKRLWAALGMPEMAKARPEDRVANRAEEAAALREIMLTRTADEWEAYLQSKHVPASRVRRMDEALADPQIVARGLTHRFEEGADGVPGPFAVPVTAFHFAHGGPSVDAPPRELGADTDAILAELGYDDAARDALRASNAI